MILPTPEQIEAGNKVAEEMFDASVESNLGGRRTFDLSNYTHKEIIQAYLNNEIDSVTGIWMAMQEVTTCPKCGTPLDMCSSCYSESHPPCISCYPINRKDTV